MKTNEDREALAHYAEALKDAGDRADWLTALVMAAIDEGLPFPEAVDAALDAFAQGDGNE